jgi:hypothetical protein
MSYYPEAITAPLLASHLGHALTVEQRGRDNFTYFKTLAYTVECLTCGEGVALEWIREGDNCECPEGWDTSSGYHDGDVCSK